MALAIRGACALCLWYRMVQELAVVTCEVRSRSFSYNHFRFAGKMEGFPNIKGFSWMALNKICDYS